MDMDESGELEVEKRGRGLNQCLADDGFAAAAEIHSSFIT